MVFISVRTTGTDLLENFNGRVGGAVLEPRMMPKSRSDWEIGKSQDGTLKEGWREENRDCNIKLPIS